MAHLGPTGPRRAPWTLLSGQIHTPFGKSRTVYITLRVDNVHWGPICFFSHIVHNLVTRCRLALHFCSFICHQPFGVSWTMGNAIQSENFVWWPFYVSLCHFQYLEVTYKSDGYRLFVLLEHMISIAIMQFGMSRYDYRFTMPSIIHTSYIKT